MPFWKDREISRQLATCSYCILLLGFAVNKLTRDKLDPNKIQNCVTHESLAIGLKEVNDFQGSKQMGVRVIAVNA